MARTITALFDTRADADAGAERLRQAGVNSVNVHDQTSHSASGHSASGFSETASADTAPADTRSSDTTGSATADSTTSKDRGLWAAIKNAVLPDEDRHTYEEGLRRGGFLLTADVEDDATPAAVRALEDANSVDLDARTQEWRAAGWNDQPGSSDLDDDTIYAGRDDVYSGSRFRSYGYPIDRS